MALSVRPRRVIMLAVTTATPDEEKSRRLRRGILPPSYERSLGHAERIELASDRPIREHNKVSYRVAHWPIWIWVFFIAPGPLTLDLFDRGFDSRMALWLGAVLVGTGIAGLRGRLPGVEPRDRLCALEHHGPCDGDHHRRVAHASALRRRVLSHRDHGVAAGRVRVF